MSAPIDAGLARKAADTIRFLAVDAVQQANSGHPGMPMGAADIAFVLWSRYLRYDPTNPDWADRDRFVLSAGHGCMLLYSLLHLAGYGLPISQLQAFRQWGSHTPGHPEFGHTVGVEATTGPLGQGVGNAVGMALAAKMVAARVNPDDATAFRPVRQTVYALASDGDLMEGISGEASSLAGHLGLGNLVVLYDDNRITIEGSTDLTYSEDVGLRYESYGWRVLETDGHDHDAIAGALDEAVAETERPTMIRCRTHIAYGSPGKQDTADSHGAPLGADEVAATKKAMGWPEEPTFLVPEDVQALFDVRATTGRALREEWDRAMIAWRGEHPGQAAAWDSDQGWDVPDDIVARLVANAPEGKAATRAHGGAVLQQAAAIVPGLVGGSADLAPSNKSVIKGSPSIARGDFSGRNIHFGIREHAMGAIVNGMLYHRTFRPYCATFLVFSDYMRPAIRLAALANLPAIYVFTHDSIFVGEDGPTHEPIEQVASMRLIPNLWVFRPADGAETALAWGMALERTGGPTALILTRQGLPPIERPGGIDLDAMRRGAYLAAGGDDPEAVIAATGSEVHLALAARDALIAEGRRVNVVSIPCLEAFDNQDRHDRWTLFPPGVPVATIEAGRTEPWRGLAGPTGLTLGIDRFGASAPASVLAERYGMTADKVTDRVRRWLGHR